MKKFDLQDWQEKLILFAKERDWEKFHTPKNLVMALSVEASELLEIFQWENDEQLMANKPAWQDKVADEMADVLVYLMRLSSVTGIDLNQALINKMKKNAQKYPAEKVKGSSKKYTDYK
jgi:dCTP diphosphatase